MAEDVGTPEGFWRLAVVPFSQVLNWAELFFSEIAYPLIRCKQLIGKVEIISQVMTLPDQLDKLVKKVAQWRDIYSEGLSWKLGSRATDVYIEMTGTVNLFGSGIGLGRDVGFCNLTSCQLMVINFIGFLGNSSLLLSSIKKVIRQISVVWSGEIGSVEFKFALMQLAGNVLLLALSVFGMATFACGNPASRLVMSCISTGIVIFSIASHYYEKLHIGDGKKTVE